SKLIIFNLNKNMQRSSNIFHVENVSQLMRYMEQPAPLHPLIAMVDYNSVSFKVFEKEEKVLLDFFKVTFKSKFSGKVKYGQDYYDFEEGGLAFLKPKQVVFTSDSIRNHEGYALFF